LSCRRTSLLERAGERRNATRSTPRLGLTALLDAPPSAAADAERSEAAGVDGASATDGVLPARVSAAASCPDEAVATRVLAAGSSSADEPVVSGGVRLASAERSMETMSVPRRASLVVRTSAAESGGTPVRRRVAAGPPEFRDDVVRPQPGAPPLCLPEDSESEAAAAASGRASPAAASVSTFQDNFVDDLGDDRASAAETSTSTVGGGDPQEEQERHFIVVAIDFGTTYSGYAFAFVRDPGAVHMMRRWEGGDPGVVNQKTPTTLLLDPAARFHSFGYAARDSYHDLDTHDAKKWLYFDKFKMVLHHNAVSAAPAPTLTSRPHRIRGGSRPKYLGAWSFPFLLSPPLTSPYPSLPLPSLFSRPPHRSSPP